MVALLSYTSALLLFVLMLQTCIDVVGRYFFNRPLTGAFEATEVVLATLIFAGLPLVTLREEHIALDLFGTNMSDRVHKLQHAASRLIGAVCTGFVSYWLWVRANTLVAAGEITPQLQIPLGWVTYAMAGLMALTALTFAVSATRPERDRAATQAAL
jgi:TRAP-type C4-dicarboxylate transport system permease small subunit